MYSNEKNHKNPHGFLNSHDKLLLSPKFHADYSTVRSICICSFYTKINIFYLKIIKISAFYRLTDTQNGQFEDCPFCFAVKNRKINDRFKVQLSLSVYDSS